MNFGFTEEQELLRAEVRKFLDQRCPLEEVRRIAETPEGFSRELWKEAAELGWLVTVADHRPAYLARGGFDRAELAVAVEPGALAAKVQLGDFDAIVVMSHHLATDRRYLAELADVDTRYLGVLGPRARRDRARRWR